MQIRWSPRASAEFDAIFEFIASDSASAAIRQARIILAATRQLETFPESGRPAKVPGTRELVITGTPYILRYSLRRDAIELISLTHGARHKSKR